MSTFLGADVVELERLGTTVATRREAVAGIISELAAEIDAVIWNGPDAELFRGQWAEGLARLFAVAEDVLTDIQQQATVQAAEQRGASEV